MRKSLNALLRLFLEPGQRPWIYLLFSMTVGVITNAVYEQLKALLSTPLAVLVVLGGVTIVFMIATVLLKKLLQPKLVMSTIKPKRGLIVLVSQGEFENIPAAEAIKYHYGPDRQGHTLEYCWLLRTPAPKNEPPEPARSSWVNAQLLEEQYRGKVKMFPKSIEADDPESVSMALLQSQQEARKLKLSDKDIVADITGGTKMMGVGMALASIVAGIDMTYLWARKTLPNGKVDTSAGWVLKRLDVEYFKKEMGKE